MGRERLEKGLHLFSHHFSCYVFQEELTIQTSPSLSSTKELQLLK
jgi:hypothetical protein